MSTERTACGAPRAADAGSEVTVFGWVDRRRDHGNLIFLDLRDHSGILQVVINPQTAPAAHAAAHGVRLEYVLRVRGKLQRRTAQNVNTRIDTGEVELHAEECTVLSVAATPPFPVNEETDVEEALRLRHRYLDLRRPRLQRNLRRRATFIAKLRAAMTEMGFTEIETPMMIRATPEGARDYLVPSRLQHGSFYALPQSPQLYKQLCMVAGLDRYFQVARCMRDEDLRADRQPEFTQLDVEMSFVDEEDVFAVLERAISTAWTASGFRGAITTPFPRLTWREAMDRYGVDKPDVRFAMELCDLTETVRGCGFRVFGDAVSSGGVVKGITVTGGADLTRPVAGLQVEQHRGGGVGRIDRDLARRPPGDERARQQEPPGGRVLVGPDLRVDGQERIFAIGDIARADTDPTPQLAQPAIQMGRHAATQIRRLEAGQETQPFRYHDKGTMATIGSRSAVVQLNHGIRIRGTIAWLAWLVLHLVTLLGGRNRINALINLSYRYLSWRRGGGFIVGDDPPAQGADGN